MRNRVSCDIVKLPHQTHQKGDHIPHVKQYNTRHGLSAIPNAVRPKYGVSRASRKYNKSRSYIYFWKSAGTEVWRPWPARPDVRTAIQISTRKTS